VTGVEGAATIQREVRGRKDEPNQEGTCLYRQISPHLEIGPAFAPIAPKSGGWNTVVVDAADQTELRTKYVGRGLPLEDIEPVDFIWRDEIDCHRDTGNAARAPEIKRAGRRRPAY
jgi:hypothetical protein